MIAFVLKRMLQVIPVVIGATLVVFIAVHLLPGDPVQLLAGHKPLDTARYLELKHTLGLDKPLYVQYFDYMNSIIRGDLGTSFQKGRSVSSIIGEKYLNSLKLALAAIFCELLIGLLAGIMAARKRGRFIDSLVDVSTIILMSIPIFWLGSMFQFYLGLKLDLLPLSGMGDGGIEYYILPAVTLASASIAIIARLLRTEMIAQVSKGYVLMARLKGASESRITFRHVLPNAIIPTITFIGIDLGGLIGGAVITEGIFNWPGIGFELFTAIGNRDHPIIFGTIIVLVAVFIFVNLLVDIVHAYLDPRVRFADEIKH